jgi:hypothetical protein
MDCSAPALCIGVRFPGRASKNVSALDYMHRDRSVHAQTLPETLAFVWRGYK